MFVSYVGTENVVLGFVCNYDNDPPLEGSTTTWSQLFLQSVCCDPACCDWMTR